MTQSKRALRVGLLLESWEIPAWKFRMLQIIQESDYADIVLVVLNEKTPPRKSMLRNAWENRANFLYRLYTRFEQCVCKAKPNAFAIENGAKLLGEAETFGVTPRQTKFWDIIDDDDVERIKSYDLDVLLLLGFRLLKGGILNCAKSGIWSFHHGDNNVLRGKPSGFWEVFEHHPVTGSMLQILNEKIDDGTVIARSYTATNQFSVLNSRNKHFWKSLALVPRKLHELYELGEDEFLKRAEVLNPAPCFYDRRMYSGSNGR